MHPDKVVRSRVLKLTDLPNVGPATAADLRLLGIQRPADLLGQSPYALYHTLCTKTGVRCVRHDPCMIDVLISITRFMSGEPARSWWGYTTERKQALAGRVDDQSRQTPAP